MIKTIVCDRCKKEISDDDIRIKKFWFREVVSVAGIYHEGTHGADCYIDLCPQCLAEFYVFMGYSDDKKKD